MNILPNVRPKNSFIPIIMHSLTAPAPSAQVTKFKQKLGNKLVTKLKDNWNRMPMREKMRRYDYLSRWTPPTGDLANQLNGECKKYMAARQRMIIERKKLIRGEVDKALRVGSGNYVPSEVAAKDAELRFEVKKYMALKFGACRCEKPTNPEPPSTAPPPPAPKYGVKASKLKCYDQREFGHDEIYFVCAAVDGNGKLITTVSPRINIDDDDDDVRYPNFWIYTMQDANGFLDVGIEMWEDDGGYGQAGQYVAAIGAGLGSIPIPLTEVAGVALVIIGSVIQLASWLDNDDYYGNAIKTWPSKATLEAGVGPYILSFYEVDTGWFDDGHDFDLTINLLTA